MDSPGPLAEQPRKKSVLRWETPSGWSTIYLIIDAAKRSAPNLLPSRPGRRLFPRGPRTKMSYIKKAGYVPIPEGEAPPPAYDTPIAASSSRTPDLALESTQPSPVSQMTVAGSTNPKQLPIGLDNKRSWVSLPLFWCREGC